MQDNLIHYVGSVTFPPNLRTTSIEPTSVTFTWDKMEALPRFNAPVTGYQYRFYKSKTYTVGTLQGVDNTQLIVDNLEPDTHHYRLCVAAISHDRVGEFTQCLSIRTPPKSMYMQCSF